MKANADIHNSLAIFFSLILVFLHVFYFELTEMNYFQIDINQLVKPITISQICGFLCLAFLVGCSSKGSTPVNVKVAQQILTSAMESWKDGKTPKDLLDGSPSIFVQELEWNDGSKLLDYEIVDDETATGPNLNAKVKLKLSKADGKVTEKTATYVVGTSPALTIYRNTMK